MVGTFVNRLGAFLQVFLVLYLVHSGYSGAQAGGALGAYGAGAVLGMMTAGGLTDRLGIRRTLMASMAFSAVPLLGVLYLPNYPAKVVAVIAAGTASQAYRPVAASALSALLPADRQVMIFAMNRLAINLGAAVLPLLGVALLSVSYDLLFWGEATVALGYAVIIAIALPRDHAGRGAPGGAAPGGAGGSYRELIADRRYLVFLAGILGLSMIYVQYLAVLPLQVRERGMGTAVYGALIALNGFLVISFELIIATRVQRWPARTAVVAGMLLTALGFSLYASPWGLAGFIIATLFWSFGEMVGAPTTYFAYPARAGPQSQRGHYLGAATGVYGLGTAIGPVVGVLLWDRVAGAVWLCCGLVGIAAAGAAYLGVRGPDARSAWVERP
jgi:predicted MFS family arabinose efflux permease